MYLRGLTFISLQLFRHKLCNKYCKKPYTDTHDSKHYSLPLCRFFFFHPRNTVAFLIGTTSGNAIWRSYTLLHIAGLEQFEVGYSYILLRQKSRNQLAWKTRKIRELSASCVYPEYILKGAWKILTN